jgi:hypothetical protein
MNARYESRQCDDFGRSEYSLWKIKSNPRIKISKDFKNLQQPTLPSHVNKNQLKWSNQHRMTLLIWKWMLDFFCCFSSFLRAHTAGQFHSPHFEPKCVNLLCGWFWCQKYAIKTIKLKRFIEYHKYNLSLCVFPRWVCDQCSHPQLYIYNK